MSHHHHSDYVEVVSSKGPAQLSSKMRGIFIAMMVVGFGTFIFQAFFNEDHNRIGWISFLHNLYFFTGISAAGVVIAAVIQVTRAMWGRPIKRFAEACGAFLPVALIGLIVLYFGAGSIYEWVDAPPDPEIYKNKNFWLQKNFVFGRQFVLLLILVLLARKFMSLSLRPDLGLAHEKNPDLWMQPSGWQGLEAEVEKSQASQSKWGVFYCVAFAVVISMFAYDLLMSLDFRWISTMFGGWNFTTCILTAFGSLILITYFMGSRFEVGHYFHKLLYHDMGKLTFGFTIMWGYLFFAQLMVIWYGNLAHETGYLITRIYDPTWRPITLTVGFMVFLIPFALGLGKVRKMSPKTFAPVVIISLTGVWLERFILIAPASWYFDRVEGVFQGGIGMLLFSDVLVFFGFFGLFALCFARYLYKHPIMPISDPRLDLGINRH